MSKFLMKPKIDFAFKEIMMNESARIGFLSAVLKINPEDIKETRILNTYLRKEHEEDKQGYDIFKRCVSISILDFKLFKETDEYYSCFHIREDKRNTIFTDKMEFHVLELPKLPKELKENNDNLLLWAKFISSEREEDFKMLATQNKHIKSAYEQLKLISQDEQKRLEYEAREKAIRDYNQMMFEAEQRGRESGIEEGKKEGREEGKQEGMKNGMVYAYYEMNLDTKEIAKKTQLTETEVIDIIKKMDM